MRYFKTVKLFSALWVLFLAADISLASICTRSDRVKVAIESHFQKSCKDILPIELRAIDYLYISSVDSFFEDDFKDLTNLNELVIEFYYGNSLPEGIFNPLVNLKRLSIYNNSLMRLDWGLKSLSPDLFKYNSKLVYLDIRQHQFNTLPEDIFKHNKNLIFVRMSRNVSYFGYNNKGHPEYRLTGLPLNIFNNIQVVDAPFERPDERDGSYWNPGGFLDPNPNLLNGKYNSPCGQNGTLEERIKDCSLEKVVKGLNGRLYTWRLVSRSEKAREVWQDVASRLLWGDIGKANINCLKAKIVFCESDKAIEAGANIPTKWHLPNIRIIKEAQSHGMFEALPRIYGDFEKRNTNYFLNEKLECNDHEASYSWHGFPGNILESPIKSGIDASNKNYPYLMRFDSFRTVKNDYGFFHRPVHARCYATSIN